MMLLTIAALILVVCGLMVGFGIEPAVKYKIISREGSDEYRLVTALRFTNNWHTEDFLYTISYDHETSLYKAGCFTGYREHLLEQLRRKKRHKLAIKFYRDQIAKIDQENINLVA